MVLAVNGFRDKSQFSEVRRPVRRVVNSEERYSLEDRATHTAAGEFFECAAHAYEGGERNDIRSVLEGYIPPRKIKIDLITKEAMLEQKASKEGNRLNIFDFQMIGLHTAQFLAPTIRQGFQFFRHNAQTANMFNKAPIFDLFSAYSNNTLGMLELPLSIVTRLWLDAIRIKYELGYEPPITHKMVRRYESAYSHPLSQEGYHKTEQVRIDRGNEKRKFLSCSIIYPTTFTQLISSPREAIERLGMDPDYFRYEKFSYPSIKNNGFKFPKLPVLKITDKYHSAWLDYLVITLSPENLVDRDKALEKLGEISDLVNAAPKISTRGYDLRI